MKLSLKFLFLGQAHRAVPSIGDMCVCLCICLSVTQLSALSFKWKNSVMRAQIFIPFFNERGAATQVILVALNNFFLISFVSVRVVCSTVLNFFKV